MRLRSRGWRPVLVIMIVVVGCSGACTRSSAVEPAFAATLRPRLLATMAQAKTPGAIVWVDVPGQGRWFEGLGVGDIHTNAPMVPADRMRVGSITKTFTATIILQLVDSHQIGLDDPVATYLPQVPNGAHITIRELLDMRSGLFNTGEDIGLLHALLADPAKVWTHEELLNHAFAHPPYFPPGQGFHYSNTNYEILGAIAERVGRAPLAQLMRQRIFTPLGMHDTLLPARDATTTIPRPHQRGYEWGINTGDKAALTDVTDWSASWVYHSGAAISTAHDMAIWAKALATGELLSPQTQQQRLMIQPPDHYGLGVFRHFGLTGHDGAVPGYQSFIGYNPQHAITVIVLTNTEIPPNAHLADALPADALAQIIQQQLCPTCPTSR